MAFVHRLIKNDEHALLSEGFQVLEKLIQNYQESDRLRRYFHLYKQKQASDVLSKRLCQRFIQFSKRVQHELFSANLLDASDEMTHFGYMVSLPGAPSQDWHIDYDGDQVTIYIPITHETEHNATQYKTEHLGYDLAFQVLTKPDEPHPLIYTPRHSMHRGVGNSEDFRRVVFYFIYSHPDWDSDEPLFEMTHKTAINVDKDIEDRYCPEVESVSTAGRSTP